MTPIFNNSWEYPRMHVWCKLGDSSSNLWWVRSLFGANFVIPAQIHDELLNRQTKFPRIRTVNISSPRAALQRRRRKCGSLTGWVGYRFLCTTSATLWPLAKPLKSALVQARKGFGTQQVPRHYGRENIFEWNFDQSNFHSRKSIENVVCKTEAILSRSQWVNNNNVVHWSHSGLDINDGGLWTVVI